MIFHFALFMETAKYDRDFFDYMFEIFKSTPEYKNRIGDQKIRKTLDNKVEDKIKDQNADYINTLMKFNKLIIIDVKDMMACINIDLMHEFYQPKIPSTINPLSTSSTF